MKWTSQNMHQKSDAIKITNTWKAIPGQLAKENKKFRFTEISKHARARDYNDIIQWLVDAGLVYKSFNVTSPKLPLMDTVKSIYLNCSYLTLVFFVQCSIFHKKQLLKVTPFSQNTTGHLQKTMLRRNSSHKVIKKFIIGPVTTAQRLIS